MAAHIVTFFNQVLTGPNNSLTDIKHAIAYARLGDNLELSDWADLNDAETLDQAKDVIKRIQPAYVAEWHALGQPRTVEAWNAAKYPVRAS
jgi:hypothetical protein